MRQTVCKRLHNLEVTRTKFGACRECLNSTNREWARKNADKRRANYGRWAAANREKVKMHGRNTNWKMNGYKNQDGSLFQAVDYDRLYQIQGGKCKVCGTHQSELKKRLYADHDHRTGVVRGLLCESHNFMLGFAHDSISELQAGIRYLSGSSL